MNRSENTRIVKSIAADLGFSFCGVSRAGFLEEEAPRVEAWLKQGYAGQMRYLHENFDKRLDPRLLVPGAKSVVSLMYNYFSSSSVALAKEDKSSYAKASEDKLKIAKYAYGEDYHFVIKDKLKIFVEQMREKI